MRSLRAATSLAKLLNGNSLGLGYASAAPAGLTSPAVTAYHSAPACCAAQDGAGEAGTGSREGRVPGEADDMRHTGDTYYATPQYPNTSPDSNASSAASEATLASSRSPHPKGPADTSSMNDPAGRGEETLSPEASEHVHHPGRPDYKEGLSQGASKRTFSTFTRLFSSSHDDGRARQRPDDDSASPTANVQDSDKPGVIKGKSSGQSDGMFSGMQSMSDSMSQGMGDRGTRDGQEMSQGMSRQGMAGGAAQGMPQPVEGMTQGSYAGAGAGSDRMVRSSEDRWSDPSAGAVAGQDGQGAELKVPESTLKGGTPTEAAEFEQAEGGRSGGIAGAWRAMTSDFAAGGDDMTGGGTAGTADDDAGVNASVSPDTGLPAMQNADDAGAHAAGFGQPRDPSAAKEQGGGEVARQTNKSSGQVPFDVSSG